MSEEKGAPRQHEAAMGRIYTVRAGGRNNVETAGCAGVRLGRVLRCYNDYPRGTAKGNYAR